MWPRIPIVVMLASLASCQDMVIIGAPSQPGEATSPPAGNDFGKGLEKITDTSTGGTDNTSKYTKTEEIEGAGKGWGYTNKDLPASSFSDFKFPTESGESINDLIGRNILKQMKQLSETDYNDANQKIQQVLQEYKNKKRPSTKQKELFLQKDQDEDISDNTDTPVDLVVSYRGKTRMEKVKKGENILELSRSRLPPPAIRQRFRRQSRGSIQDNIGRDFLDQLKELSESDRNEANQKILEILTQFRKKSGCSAKQQPRGTPTTVCSLNIKSDIKYRYATTLVTTTAVNPNKVAGQATFTITLPESAFISEFLMEIKGIAYKAYVKNKDEAKAVYNKAVDAGQTAGHVAFGARNSNLFTMTVNIEAQGEVVFKLTYEQLLERSLGVYRHIINISPQQVVEDMSVTINIEEPTAIMNLEVTDLQRSNEAIVTKPGEYTKLNINNSKRKEVVWSFSPDEQRHRNSSELNMQLIVEYDIMREESPQQIIIDEGYFVHFFAPENVPKLRKHVIFVLDFSYSMYGRKDTQLKEAMNEIFSDMTPHDYFSLVIFNRNVRVWSLTDMYFTNATSSVGSLGRGHVVEATTANIKRALAFIRAQPPSYTTNIMGGLRVGLRLAAIGEEELGNESDRPQPLIFFLTDGDPTDEETDTKVIRRKVKALNSKGNPIFSLAFGSGADSNFLRKLSLQNFGFARNIYEAADAAEQIKNFYKTIASPLLNNVTFSYLPGQVDESFNTPQDSPTYYGGSEMVMSGKFKRMDFVDGETIGEVRGMSATGPKSYPIIVHRSSVEANRSTSRTEKTWSYLTIQKLLTKADSLESGEEKRDTKKRALDIALKYAFVTPLTSLTVVKPGGVESFVDTTKIDKVADSYSLPPVITIVPDSSVVQPDVPLKKIPLQDVTWIQQTNKTTVLKKSVTIGGSNYTIGTNETDSSFGDCNMNNSSGECRHLQYCALDVFQNDISKFLPYKCPVLELYLVVCCPTYLL